MSEPLSNDDQDLIDLLAADLSFGSAQRTAPADTLPAPLSVAQQRLWFMQRYEPSSTAYNIVHGFDLDGPLDLARLTRAFERVIGRHEILRTRFVEHDGVTCQKVLDAVDFAITHRRLDAAGLLNGQGWHHSLLQSEARKPFDLDGSLLRVCVHSAGEVRHLLVVALHHLVSDGWSNAIWARDLAAAYEAASISPHGAAQPAPRWPALPIQYADHARREAQYLRSDAACADLDYWRTALGTRLPVLNLPTDRFRPDVLRFRGAAHTVHAGADIAARIAAFCARERITPFVFCLAAFQLVLARVSQQDEFLVGVPGAGRHWPDVDNLIGFFVDLQIYRARPDAQLPVRDWLRRIQAESVGALNHPGLPFERLLEALGVERSVNRHPLFQVTFGYQDTAKPATLKLGDMRVNVVDLPADDAKFDLTLHVGFNAQRIEARFVYDVDLFDAATIARLAAQYEIALDALLTQADAPLGALDILDGAQRASLLARGRTDERYPCTPPAHVSIAQRAAQAPGEPALLFGDFTLSYGELNTRANRVAHRLIALGVKPEMRVGVAAERSVELIVALLAVLKAGAAYVPLDPAYPTDRLAYMLDDSGIALLLTQSHLHGGLPSREGMRLIDLDSAAFATEPAHDPDVRVFDGTLAYVVYTSGSTGRPKGVGVAHGPLSMHLQAIAQRYDVQPGDRELQFFSISFDAAAEQWLTPLVNGAAIVIRDMGDWSPERLLAEARDKRVTILHLPPAYVDLLPSTAGVDSVSIKTCISGGEGWQKSGFDAVRRSLCPQRIVNAYGPAETVITPTAWIADADSVFDSAYAPIGRPVGERCVYVLDPDMNLLADRLHGELYIGGHGMARGYMGRAALTAERFVPDPFSQDGARLYRTGDLVCWGADGELEYQGRLDHQVKIRGFRIELGEVESALLKQPGVREAVVVAQEGPGGARLVGYVSARADAGAAESTIALDVTTLRAALLAELPDYMVPGALVVMDALPINPNGKVDRRALPVPQFDREVYAAPQSDAEMALAAAWCEILGIDEIGRHHNFFELGGDSILSLQIVARAREAGWKITPRQLFERQTIAELAAVAISLNPGLNPAFDADAGFAAEETLAHGPIGLLPIQREFFGSDIPNRNHWNQSVLLSSDTPIDATRLHDALRAVQAHHDALGLRFTCDARGNWHQQPGAVLSDAQPILWTRRADTREQIEALCNEAQLSLDIERGALLRVLLIDVADGTSRVLLTVHHLVIDGVSWRILLDDLQRAFAQLASERAPDDVRLPSNGTSYRAWSRRLTAYAASDAVQAQRAYWRTQLATSASLPCDEDSLRGAAQTRETRALLRTTELQFDSSLTQRLLQVAPAAYRTQVNDLLLTALGRALCAWTGSPAIRIDLEGHGREDLFDDVDLSRTVGWFTSVHPVVLDAGGEPGAALKRVKEALRNVPDHGLGYGLLPDVQAHSDTLFNYLGQIDGQLDTHAGWRAATESPGATNDPHARLTYPLSIAGQVFDGELHLTLAWSSVRFDQATIARVVEGLRAELVGLIDHCANGENGAGGVTPSDFPLAGLTQPELDALTATLPVAVRELQDLYPLPPMQAGMLFHTWLTPDDSAYRNQLRVDLDGLDAHRFRAAWRAVIERHDILRTGFLQHRHALLQWVAKNASLPLDELDWRERASRDGASIPVELDALAQAELAKGFDVTRPPLQRLALVRTGDTRYHLIWTVHHVLLDGWSASQLIGDVLRHYGGEPLAARGGRYRDYVEWLLKRDPGASETYWRDQLAGFDTPTRLAPALRGNAAAAEAGDAATTKNAGYAEAYLDLDGAASERLSGFARQERVTVNTLVQAAWALLLQRYTSQDMVAFGATVAGRPDDLPGAQQLLGLFINTLPVIASPRAGMRVGDWLRAMQAQALASREHEHTPLNEIQRWAGAGGEALFDSLMVFENYPVDAALKAAAPGGLQVLDVSSHEQTHYPLTLTVAQIDGVLRARCSFAQDGIDAAAVTQLLKQFGLLLNGLCDAGFVGELTLLDDDSSALQQHAGCSTDSFADAAAVHELIERQAAATPEAIALVCGDEALDYAALNTRANRLAHRLIREGVRGDVMVAVALERSVDMLVALLAVLKAGGAYVPLDPSYPAARLGYMLDDCRAPLLLTQRAVAHALPVGEHTRVIEVDALDVSAEPAGNPVVAASGERLAYVIYTSGSTGKPKGTMVRHAALTNFLHGVAREPGLKANDTLVAVTSLSFDIAALELFLPLTVGAKVVLASRDEARDARLLAGLLDPARKHSATAMQSTPATWRMLLDSGWPAGAQRVSLKGLCGGEALPGELAVRLRAAGVDLWNMYGPTETTIWSSVAHVGEDAPTLGQPLPATQLRVLDASLNLVPRGIVGELYIGGEALARGYLKRAALTAERFVPDPFSTQGGRLYRTGDLARWRADGELEYLGRIDHQIKIRGFRIELGEVEAQLLAQPDVREAVVTAQGAAGGMRLVGYVAPHAGVTLDGASLRAALSAALPDYMVPSAVVVLDTLPLTPNGKVDRKALPAPEFQTRGYEAPQGELETTLAALFEQVLEVERVGRHDNFFELGGDSILSLKVVAQAHHAGIAITPRQLFDTQTVAALAQVLVQARDDGATQPVVPPITVIAAGERTALPLSHAQQRLWFLWNLQPESSAYHMPGALRLSGELDTQAVRESIDAVVARHESLRTTFTAQADGEVVQSIGTDTRCDWRFIDVSGSDDVETTLASTANAFAAEPFDLVHGPLLRVALIRVGEYEHVLAVVMHHIVSDGWSVDVLLREFVEGYRALREGRPAQLRALPVQYADYARWQRRWLEAGEQARQLVYWRAQLGDAHPVLALPSDRARQAVSVWHGATHRIGIPDTLARAIRERARELRATPFVVLLAGFQLLLHRYTAQGDIRVGVPAANRERVETEGLIGLFVNTLVMRAQMDGGTSLTTLLETVKRDAQAAQRHQDLPFDVLVDALQPQRSLSHAPLFQVMFNHLRDDERVLDTLPGVRVGWYGLSEAMAQFELTLNTTEASDGTMSASFVYARELFDARTVERLAEHYVASLNALVSGRVSTVADVELMSDEGRAGLLDFSRSDADYGEALPVHRVIEAQVRRTPDAQAVLFGDTALTYAELNARANQLAHRLLAQGVGPDVRVGIAVERSVEMVVGLLAIMKAGGAYVPFDPSYPAARLGYMMADSGIALLLTQRRVRDALPLSDAIEVLELDALDLADEPSHNPDVGLDGENLAYVIYTSGSTGQPKGAANRHSALYNRLVWMQQAYALDATDTVLQKTPFSFDVSVWEFFWPLMTGARLAVAAPDDHRDPQKLVELIERHAVTTLHFVPSMLQAFIAYEGAQWCSGLRRVICSGEALSTELKDRALAALPAAALYNLYGPTEAAIDVTHWTCEADDTVTPIGRPIANVQTVVLDASLNMTPVGVAGELYLGGAGLARGYLNRSALTAERFVPDPFSAEGARLYRTGDLARWRADGALEYLGRIDHQVKIRGFRIELGEIEAQLLAQANVREAVVIAQESSTGTRLIAYVSANAHTALVVSTLREALAEALPGHMVPSVIIVLDTLPLSPNGKVDRKALPAPEQSTTADRATAYEPPENPTESAIAAIWQDILGIERIGRHDNFFELGGHSLLTMKAQRAIFRDLQTDVPLASLFLKPTLHEIAAECEALHVNTQREQHDNVREMKSLLDELMD